MRKSVKDLVIKFIEELPIGTRFYGHEVKSYVVRYMPEKEHCYVDSFLRTARRFCRESFKAINGSKSLYEKV